MDEKEAEARPLMGTIFLVLERITCVLKACLNSSKIVQKKYDKKNKLTVFPHVEVVTIKKTLKSFFMLGSLCVS